MLFPKITEDRAKRDPKVEMGRSLGRKVRKRMDSIVHRPCYCILQFELKIHTCGYILGYIIGFTLFTLNCNAMRKMLRILAISLPGSPLDPFMLKLYFRWWLNEF